MNYYLLSTLEILLVVVLPLIILYERGNWPLRATVPCLVSVPILWYLSYAPIHELSHIAGTYLVGGTVTEYKLIPRFWMGEYGRAWINTQGVSEPWQQLIMTTSPYILDILCLAASFIVLRRGFSRNPFLIGLVFMLLCLRSAFDFVCESIGFVSGDRGDFYAIQGMIGSALTWLFILLSLVLSLFSIVTVLRRSAGFPGTESVQANA
jgi:hypothetical protein